MNKGTRTLGAFAWMSAWATCAIAFGIAGPSVRSAGTDLPSPAAWGQDARDPAAKGARGAAGEVRPDSELIAEEFLLDRLPWPGRVRPQGSDGSYLTTLYAMDPSSSCIRLTDGEPGRGILGNWPENLGGHLNFGGLLKDGFGVAYQDWQLGTILDIGPYTQLHPEQANYEEVGSFIGFASLSRIADEATFTRSMWIHDGTEPYGGAQVAGVEDLWLPNGTKETAPVKLGHVYLIRIVHELEDMRELVMVKALVVDHTPGVSVTIRWMHF